MPNYISLHVLVTHIFIRLPVKSLLNCSRVCKLWLRTISGSEFKRIHAQHQAKDEQRHQNVLCGPLKYRFGYDIWETSQDKIREFDHKVSACSGIFYSLDLETTPPKLNRLPGFQVHRINNFKLIKTLGYSSGMLCMEARSTSNGRWPHIFFGNPSTGYYKILPDPLINGPLIVGFGYDSSTDDYKFVRIDNVTRHPNIYSLKSNSWTTNVQSQSNKHKRKLEYSVLPDYYVSQGTFVNGSIYWYVKASIVRFDLKEEKFSELPMPGGVMYDDILLKDVQGSVCMINNRHFLRRTDIDVDMWLLKEKKTNIVGNKYFWTKLLNLRELYAGCIYPLAFMKDGKMVCCVEHKYEVKYNPPKKQYVVADLRANSIQDFNISGINSGILKEFKFQSQFPGYIDTLLTPNVRRGAKQRAVRNESEPMLDTLQTHFTPLERGRQA